MTNPMEANHAQAERPPRSLELGAVRRADVSHPVAVDQATGELAADHHPGRQYDHLRVVCLRQLPLGLAVVSWLLMGFLFFTGLYLGKW